MANENVMMICHFNGTLNVDSRGFPNYIGGRTKMLKIPKSSTFNYFKEKIYHVTRINPNEYEIKLVCKFPTTNQDYTSVEVADDVDTSLMLSMFPQVPSIQILVVKEEIQINQPSEPQGGFSRMLDMNTDSFEFMSPQAAYRDEGTSTIPYTYQTTSPQAVYGDEDTSTISYTYPTTSTSHFVEYPIMNETTEGGTSAFASYIPPILSRTVSRIQIRDVTGPQRMYDEGKTMENCKHNLEGKDGLMLDGSNQADQISRLCDAIIHHILSFLPMRDAAQTCTLSKRWRKLWASIPVLDFNQNCFLHKIGGALRSHPARALVDFMSGAILCREQAPINVLRLSLKYSPSFYYPVRQWIQLSVKLNVQEVDLDFSGGDFFFKHRRLLSSDPLQGYYCDDDDRPSWDYDSESDSPSDESDSADELDAVEESDSADEEDSINNKSDCSSSDDESESARFIILPSLVTYESLRVLQLTKCNIIHEGPMAFGNIASLVLRDVDVSEKALHQMLTSCPILEKLEMRRIVGLKHLEFSAPKLLSMKFECCHSLKEVSIDAQELRHLKFGLSHTIEMLSLHFPSLIKAEIGLCRNTSWNRTKRAERLVKLLRDLSHVTDLALYSRFFKDLHFPKCQMKNFTMSKVRRFEMIGKMGDDAISALFGLLKAFDNLESLCLSFVHPNQAQKELEDSHEEKKRRKLSSTAVSCLQSNLKELKIHGFDGNDAEIKLLKFLLDKAKVLENLDIQTYTPSFLTHREINARLLKWCSSQDLNLRYR